MSSKLAILLAAVAVAAAVPRNHKNVTIASRPNHDHVNYYNCRGLANGPYVHPWDCTRFIICSNGYASDMACPDCGTSSECAGSPYLRWDNSAQRCEWPVNTPCEISEATEDPETTEDSWTTADPETSTQEEEVWPCNGRKAGDECDPNDCKLCGYCNNTANYYFWCKRIIPGDPKLPITGVIVHSECDSALWWDPELETEVGFEAGACTRWEFLSPDVQKSYAEDRRCTAHRSYCDWSQDEDQRCTQNYWYAEDVSVPVRTDLACDSDLIWDNSTKTCRLCDNVEGCVSVSGSCQVVTLTPLNFETK